MEHVVIAIKGGCVRPVEKLAELQVQGKIAHIGLSNVSVQEIERAQTIAEIVSVQNRCNLHDLSAFASGVVEYCTNNNLAFISYSPVGGKFGHTQLSKDPFLNKIGAKYNASALQIALAWLLVKAPNIIPIPGASKVINVESSAAAMGIKLAPEDVSAIDAELM